MNKAEFGRLCERPLSSKEKKQKEIEDLIQNTVKTGCWQLSVKTNLAFSSRKQSTYWANTDKYNCCWIK